MYSQVCEGDCPACETVWTAGGFNPLNPATVMVPDLPLADEFALTR